MAPRRWLAACGPAAALAFPVAVATLAALRPGFDHVRDVMSKLGEAGSPNAWAMNALGFGLLAALTAGFALALRDRFPERPTARAAALVAVGALAILAVGLLPCDPGCRELSALGRLHSPAAAVAAGGMLLGVLGFARAWWDDPAWRSHARLTLALCAPSLVAGAMYTSRAFPDIMGGLQRVALAGPLAWMAITGWRMLRRSAVRGSSP